MSNMAHLSKASFANTSSTLTLTRGKIYKMSKIQFLNVSSLHNSKYVVFTFVSFGEARYRSHGPGQCTTPHSNKNTINN